MTKNKTVFDMYRMRVTDTRKRAAVMPLPLSYQIEMTAVQEEFMRRFEEEKIFTIELLESDLRRMEDDLAYFHQARNPYEREEMEQRESLLRRNKPAVKKAWENYKMLVKLAAGGRVYD